MSIFNVGVDLGVTSKHKATILNDSGKKVLPQISFGTSSEEYEKLLNHCFSGETEDIRINVICEPTAMAWFPLTQYLVSRGHKVYRVKTQKVSDLRKFFKKNTKTDAIDSMTLAKMPLIDEESLYEVHLPDAKSFMLERKSKQRDKIIKSTTARKNRIWATISFSCPKLLTCFDDLYSERALAFFSKYSNPHKVRQLGIKKLKTFLEKASSDKIEENLAENIFKACLDAIEIYRGGNYLDFEGIQEEINVELRLLEAEKTELFLLESQIKKLYKELDPNDFLGSLPGIGEILAPVLYTLVGDPHRFENQRKFKSFTGMIPGKNESGSSDKKGIKITKSGRKELKRALYLAADIARQWDPELAKFYYEQMVNKGNCHTKAVCAVSTKLAQRVLRILKDKRPYVIRDLNGRPITTSEAKAIINAHWKVPEEVRKRKRNKKVGEKEKHVKVSVRASEAAQ